MEIVQLSKSTFNNQLQQSTYLYDKSNMSQIWEVNTFWQSQRSHHKNAHLHPLNLHPLTNVPTKYQFPMPYSFRDIAQTIF